MRRSFCVGEPILKFNLIIFGISGGIILLGMGLFCIETVFDKNHFFSNLRLFFAPKTGFCLSSSYHVSKDKKKIPILVLFLSNFSKKRWFEIRKRSKAFLYADMTGLDKVQFTVELNLNRNGKKSTQCFIIKWKSQFWV